MNNLWSECQQPRRHIAWGLSQALICLALALIAMPRSTRALTLGQVDNFQDSTTDGWGTGGGTQPIAITSGGPLGAGDEYLQVISKGGGGTDSKLIILNTSQWLGDYTDAGITGISLDLANFGTQTLSMRLAFFISKPVGYAATTPFSLPADSNWHQAFFPLVAADFTAVGSPSVSFAAMLTNFSGQLRILDSATPAVEGASIATTLGVDNVAAVPEPSAFAMMVVGALGLFSCVRCASTRSNRGRTGPVPD
jgi:hypothetical protein